jgi:hypothetical protein
MSGERIYREILYHQITDFVIYLCMMLSGLSVNMQLQRVFDGSSSGGFQYYLIVMWKTKDSLRMQLQVIMLTYC